MASRVIYYDANCPLCVALASWLKRRGDSNLGFEPWPTESDHPSKAQEIGLWDGETTRVGSDAWSAILQLHPDFKGLNWIAARLHLVPTLTRTAQSVGKVLRRACAQCPD